MTVKRTNAYNVNSIFKSKVKLALSELDKSYENFLSGIATPKTQITYECNFKKFVKWGKFTSYDSILEIDDKTLTQIFKDYMTHLKGKGLRYGSLKIAFSSIRLFLELNDKPLSYTSIKKIMGKETKQKGGRKAYTPKQMQKIFEKTVSIRTKALVSTMSSSGMRKGAIPELKVGNLKRQSDGGALIVVYEGDKEEYVAGLTPEAVFYIDCMLDIRRNAGLEVNEDSFLFTANTQGTDNPTNDKITENGITMILKSAVKNAKIQRTKTGNRFDISVIHGIRKFFNTQCHKVKYTINDKSVQAIETDMIERLMGHDQTSVKMTYLDTDESELYAEYQKAIPALTISQEWKLKEENQKLQEQVLKPETESMERITHLEEIIAKQQKQIEELTQEPFARMCQDVQPTKNPSIVEQLLLELQGMKKQQTVSPQAN